MSKYLVVDGMLSGTGIRDYYEGGYIEPEELGISKELVSRIKKWVSACAIEHYNGFKNLNTTELLENEGKEIAREL